MLLTSPAATLLLRCRSRIDPRRSRPLLLTSRALLTNSRPAVQFRGLANNSRGCSISSNQAVVYSYSKSRQRRAQGAGEQTMRIVIGNVLSAADLNELRAMLANVSFANGRATAGFAAREVKHNLQVAADPSLDA